MINNNEDKEKANELYNKYNRLMLYIAKGILKDKALAEDAVSQAFINIIQNLDKIDMNNCNETMGFVVTIVRHISFNMLKAQKRNTAHETEIVEITDGAETVFDIVSANEACKKIADEIGNLNSKYAEILYLKLYMEYTNEEIADILGISRENVLVRYHRAIKALKRKLQEEMFL